MRGSVRKRALESSASIEQLYITMRHLFSRGFYKPMGMSGASLREALKQLSPEIYGSMNEDKIELDGLLYVLDRLPIGIEECRYVSLTADEGYSESGFIKINPEKRRRDCYRIDKDQMNIEVTRGRSEIYDILTHLTFLYIESHKIKDAVLIPESDKVVREWEFLRDIVVNNKNLQAQEEEVVLAYLGKILGRSFQEVKESYSKFSTKERPFRFLHVVYWLGYLAINESLLNQKREISFSRILQDQIGHHIYGSVWADNVKQVLVVNELLERPIHIVSANMHSVMNSIYAPEALKKVLNFEDSDDLFEKLGEAESDKLRSMVKHYAAENGLIYIKDTSKTNINVQIIDTSKIDFNKTNYSKPKEDLVIVVMDYAFGEQAYETMSELLKPYQDNIYFDIQSISVIGKAGILQGEKGDIMIPTAQIFEGSEDNYLINNSFCKSDFENNGLGVYEGPMVTVLGTSLQNQDVLRYFNESRWKTIGLEMEGVYYQKAIQAASLIKGDISQNVKVRYAYYASDNPLKTGATLASGGLGITGVKPTYLITQKILEQVF